MTRKTLRWLMPVVLAGSFMAASAVFAHGKGGKQSAPASKKVKSRQHRRELRYQRRRIKQSRKRVRAEARQYGHSTPPKVERHQMTKVQRHSIRQSPNLRRARKQARRRRAVRHPAKMK